MRDMLRNTRMRIAICLLTAIILMCFWSAIQVRKSCDRLLKCTDAAIYAADTLHKENLAGELGAIVRRWKKDSPLLHLFVPAQPLTDLNEAILRLEALDAADSDELTAELCAVRADLLWIRGHELTVF
ncbi:MAG: DUF4363 family protein [Oscillospiraceae bacterium]|nr:DUF4363 family protein [Oscillospiraceae bacterium]